MALRSAQALNSTGSVTMWERIKSYFRPPDAGSPPVEDERVRLATAVLFVEVALADDNFGDRERQHIHAVLQKRFDLSADEAEGLLSEACQEREDSYDVWRFTRRINESCTVQEKERIIEEVWRVIYADTRLDPDEDHAVHKLARLLNLDHAQLIQAKLRAKQKRA